MFFFFVLGSFVTKNATGDETLQLKRTTPTPLGVSTILYKAISNYKPVYAVYVRLRAWAQLKNGTELQTAQDGLAYIYT